MALTPVIIKSVLRGEEQRLRKHFLPAGEIAVISDVNTWQVGGKAWAEHIDDARAITYDTPPRPTVATAELLAADISGCRGVIAVGSGTLNDLCKYASHRLRIPYLVITTAPSMNGYLSANASLENLSGLKSSHETHKPVAVCAELDTLANAPLRLIQAGLGDALAVFTARIDWLFSHLMLGTAYDDRIYQMISPHMEAVMDSAKRLLKRDAMAIEQLFRLLLMGGEGMTRMHSSIPYSGGEHMIAHTLEMQHGERVKQYLHGEQIAITSFTMATLQEHFLKHESVEWQMDDAPESMATEGYRAKQAAMEATPLTASRWQEVRTALQPYLYPAEQLLHLLEVADLQTDPSTLGISLNQYATAVDSARYTRDRLTFLDIK